MAYITMPEEEVTSQKQDAAGHGNSSVHMLILFLSLLKIEYISSTFTNISLSEPIEGLNAQN